MDGKVVVLLRTSSVARAPVYRHLSEQCGVVLVLVHPTQPSHEFGDSFHYWLQEDTHCPIQLEPKLRNFLCLHGLHPDAIISFDEYAVYSAAVLSESMLGSGRATPFSAQDIKTTNQKYLFREFCVKEGLSVPRATVLRRPPLGSGLAMDERLSYVSHCVEASGLPLPLVLKPSPGAGSLLVKLCATMEEVAEHAWRMWEALDNHPDVRHFRALLMPGCCCCCGGSSSSSSPACVEILMEEFIGGTEVDMDCVVDRGQLVFCSISDNFETTPPYFAEVGGLCPSALDLDAQMALKELLLSYVACYGECLHGVLHFEAKYDAVRGKAYIIEVNCRMGSAETNTMVRTAYRGFQLGEALVRCALGLSVQEQLHCLYPIEDSDNNNDMKESIVCDCCCNPADCSCYNDNTNVEEKTQEEEAHKLSACIAGNCYDAANSGAGGGGAVGVRAFNDTVVRGLGGSRAGFYPICAFAASVNIYPVCAGTVRRVAAPLSDPHLVAHSVSAVVGDAVAPPPGRFYLLCWMVAEGTSAACARKRIAAMTANFEQDIVC